MKTNGVPCPGKGKSDRWRKTWTISDAGRDLYVVREQDERACDEPLEPAEVRPFLSRWRADSTELAVLVELYSSLRASPLAPGASEAVVRQTVIPRLRKAFELRELLLVEPEPIGVFSGPVIEAFLQRSQPQRPAAQSAAKEAVKTWIEFRLVNQNGDPIPGARYRMKSTDGSTREGRLDDGGSVRVRGIDPGTCEITFLDYDGREWKRV